MYYRAQQSPPQLCTGPHPPRPDAGPDGHRGDPPPLCQGQGTLRIPPTGQVGTDFIDIDINNLFFLNSFLLTFPFSAFF